MAKNKIDYKKIIVFLFFTLIAIGIRIIPFPGIEKRDLLVHYDWSKTIYKEGLKDIYFHSGWSYSPPTQPPLMMLAFWTSRHLYENRYLLSELHNLVHIPPSRSIIWFDLHGEYLLLRLWAILGDILSALLIYFLIKRYLKNPKLAFVSFVFMLFNPLSLFESTIWGQNDIISIVFIYSSFFLLLSKKNTLFTPLLFLVGLLIKPTSLILLPLFSIFYLKQMTSKVISLTKITISLLLCIGLIFLVFKPFINIQNNYLTEVKNIIVNRMAPSSKGIGRASNSAFNIYSLVYDLDKTLGSKKTLGLSLDIIGIVLYVLINIYIARLLLSSKKNFSPTSLSFYIFFISQASFLFMTGMLERYFFPAFLASILLIFFDFKNFGIYMFIQNLLWFLNIIYSYYQREVTWIKNLFEMDHFLLIRILSLASIINFLLIFRSYFKKYFPTKNQY